MTFDPLKAELPKTDNHPFNSADIKECKKENNEVGGSLLFKGERVRDAVECSKYSKPCCINYMYPFNNKRKYKYYKLEQEKNLCYKAVC